jgi:hypothetical protein
LEKKRKKKTKTKKQGKISTKKKKNMGKANLYQAYHHELVQNQSSLFNLRNRYNIIITVEKTKRLRGERKKIK